MRSRRIVGPRVALVAAAVGLGCAFGAAPASAGVTVSFERMPGYRAPGTPARYDKVGVLKTGPRNPRNILVLVPGTSASAAYFEPLAKDIVRRSPGWAVWSVERRENLLEDQSELNLAKQGKATNRQLFDYYLGWLTNPAIKRHFKFIPDSSVGYARGWGMRVAVGDLRRVVLAAQRHGRRVVLGGHSLGGTITTAYATWDFGGRPGARGLSGLVYIDGGSGPAPVTAATAVKSLRNLRAGSPWLTFGTIPSPYTGLFNATGAAGAILDPNGPSIGQAWPALPADLKPPIPATNAAQYGYALDTATSPPSLAAAQAHLGRLAASGNPRGWDQAGELTPLRRYAVMFSGWGLRGLDGTAWYHPLRLTIDGGAVADGNANPAQRVLGVSATKGHALPRDLRIYAFAASLGGPRVLTAARILARQSRIPARNLTLVDRHATYAHNDPAGASPRNDFLRYLAPFLKGVARR